MFVPKVLIFMASAIVLVNCNCCIRYGQRANSLGGMDTYCQIPFPCIGGVSPPLLPTGMGGRFPGMGGYPGSGGGNWGQWGTSNIPFPGFPGNYRNARDAQNSQNVPSVSELGNEIKMEPKAVNQLEFWPNMDSDPKMAVETKYEDMKPTNEIGGK